MIHNELLKVSVISYSSGSDAYGQPRKTEDERRSIDMYMKVYQQSNVSDVRYVDVTNVGLTKDNSITDANVIEYDGIKYDVLYVIPSHRWNTIMLKKIKQ